MSRFSFWRAVMITAVAVLATAALLPALQAPAQPSAQAHSACRSIHPVGNMYVTGINGKAQVITNSASINYTAYVMPGQTDTKVFSAAAGVGTGLTTGRLTITLMHPTTDTISASAQMVTTRNGAVSRSPLIQVGPFPAGNSMPMKISAGGASANLTVFSSNNPDSCGINW